MKKYVINFFLKNSDFDSEIVKYGLEAMYIMIEKTIILIVISLILGILKEMVVFIFFFSIIRTTAFGIHLDSSLKCTVFSISAFVLCTYLSILDFDFCTILALFALSLINILINAPAESMRNVDIKKYKLISVMIALIYGNIIFYFEFYNPLYALLLESMLISKTMRRMKWSKC